MHKKKIIFFGAGKFQKKILNILKKNFFLITIDENKNAHSSKISNLFLNFKFDDTNKIYNYLKKKKIVPYNIISLNSDAGFIAAEKLKKKFSISKLQSKTFKIFFDKYHLLKFLKKNNFPCSEFRLLENKKLKDFFIKPRRSSGSRNIILMKKNSFKGKLNINDYIIHKKIKGQEFVIDGLISNKKIINFLISKKIKFKNSSTVSQTIYSKLNLIGINLQNKCLETIQNFLNKSNFNYGIFHIEFILSDNNFFIIDVAPRGPGFFVFEDYVMKYLGKKNILKYINNEEFFKNKNHKDFNYMLIHFLPTQDGRFKKIIFNKKLKNFKFQKFIKNNSLTSSVKVDNDRVGSFILYSKKEIKIKKEIKKIYQSIKIEYHENFYNQTRRKN